ncbi:PDZ domain-containing protein [bacterium]|nr:PDZ domain-containing protein [bacterium]
MFRALSTAVLVFLFALPAKAESATLQCKILPTMFGIYLKSHYSVKKLTPELKQRTVDQFLKELDRSKNTLLSGDVKTLRAKLLGTFDTMNTGNCSPIADAFNVYTKRAEENEAFAKKYLGDDYKLDETVELILDPKKRDYSNTAEERDALLKKLIHFQISNYLISDMKLPEAKKQLAHQYELVTKRTKEKTEENQLETFAEAFAQALDPHSSFMSRDSMEDFQIGMELSLEGIGAVLRSQNGFTIIESLIKGGGAEKSKSLKPKDKIIAVSQATGKPVSVIDMDLRDVVKLIRGKKGTTVKLTILRQDDETKNFDVAIIRDKINIEEQAAKIRYVKPTVAGKKVTLGIIDLPSFYGSGKKGTRSSSADVKKLLDDAKKQKASGIVLNLASNGGGLLEEAVAISGLFINRGAVVATKSADAEEEILNDEENGVAWKGPLVVLTSRASASASEILAGALRDYHRAVIVGSDHTFGKGTVQAVANLPLNIGGMKVTTGMFFLPAGASTQHEGVPSDIALPPTFNDSDVGEKTLDYSLPPQKIKTFTSQNANSTDAVQKWNPITTEIVKSLNEKSKARVSKNQKFADLIKKVTESKKNEGLIRLADMRKMATDEKKKSDANKKKRPVTTPDEDDDMEAVNSPLVEEATSILGDLVEQSPQTLAGT